MFIPPGSRQPRAAWQRDVRKLAAPPLRILGCVATVERSDAASGCRGRRDRRILWRPVGAGRTRRDVSGAGWARRAVAREGLQIVSPHGDVTLAPKLVTLGGVSSPYDVVLLAVKAYALEAAMDDFAAAVGGGTMILPVLNGMRHIDVLAARFGEAAVLGGVCVVATTLDDAGRIVQLAEVQQLTYGERDGTLRESCGARLSANRLWQPNRKGIRGKSPERHHFRRFGHLVRRPS